jgi:predicted Mrr-cat superfamily restriction endonuclease
MIDQLMEHYDQMPAEVQTALPLKRAWILVQEE